MMSSEIFKKMDFLWDKERKIRSCGSGLARNHYFAKREGLQTQVKKFYKYIKIGIRDKQISATQTYNIWGPGGVAPCHWRLWQCCRVGVEGVESFYR